MSPPSLPKLTSKRRSDCLLLRISATTSWRNLLPQVSAAPVTSSPHLATVPHLPPPIRSNQKLCLRMTKISTNTSCSGTEFPSAIYPVGAKKTNDCHADLATADCCHGYYYVLDHNERFYSDTEIVHTNQTSPSIPSTGKNMVYDDDPNRAAAVDDFFRSYLEEGLGDLPEYLSPIRNNNTSNNLIMPKLAPEIPYINFHACACHILTGLFALVTAVLCLLLPSNYFQLTVSINVAYMQ